MDMTISEHFGNWVLVELEKRGAKQADLARATGLSTAYIANMVNNQKGVSPDTCRKIASYLGVPELEVLRRAGIITTRPATSPLTEAIIELGGQLNADDQQTLLDLARAMALRRKRNESNPD